MGCIWIGRLDLAMPHEDQFNYNMGCIWMRERRMYLFAWMGLTITWDVFEWYWLHPELITVMFNYNMGCIWISVLTSGRPFPHCLTITWDVFEWYGHGFTGRFYQSLTITWDVFELAIQAAYPNYRPFNYNMGCIWMTLVFAQDVEKEV